MQLTKHSLLRKLNNNKLRVYTFLIKKVITETKVLNSDIKNIQLLYSELLKPFVF